MKRATFSWLFIPLSILIFLAFALFIERSGISYTVSRKPIDFLDPLPSSDVMDNQHSTNIIHDCLILTYADSLVKDTAYKVVSATLNSMKIPYSQQEISSDPIIHFPQYNTIIITFNELSQLTDSTENLMRWVQDGGKLIFALRPDNSQTIHNILPQLGIDYLDPGYTQSDGIEFLTPLLPGSSGVTYGLDYMVHSSLPVNLSPSTTIHAISADDQGIPLIWEQPLGQGSILFINSDQFMDKSSRGLMGAVYSLLQDIVIYPVINAVTFHVDDFPAPIPEGIDDKVFSQFTRDIKSFYLNVWWPDMQALKEKYDLVYTAFVIETYNYQTNAPFVYDVNQEDVFQYFGGLVLRDGGEVGLHGYNHIPLCMENEEKNKILDYPAWDSQDSMQSSVKELEQFSASMLSGQPFRAYVPPSNLLCDGSRAWLPEVLTDLKVIASVYLPDEDVPAYVQEYEEAPDGIIEYPRITSGYAPSDFMRWAQANELWLHYAAGHFVHPDDVLDSYRSGGKTWLEMRETLDEYLLWLFSAMPNARNLTATEGGMAVQRYARVHPEYECERDACNIHLKDFYDEVWLMMRTEQTPKSISSGSFIEVMDHLYLIEADTENFRIEFETVP